jgi:hypothetical protein
MEIWSVFAAGGRKKASHTSTHSIFRTHWTSSHVHPSYTTKSLFQFSKKRSMWETAALGPWFFNDQCDKTIVQGTMDAGKYSIIYVGLILGPNKTDKICGKTMVMRTLHWGSTVYLFWRLLFETHLLLAISNVNVYWIVCSCYLWNKKHGESSRLFLQLYILNIPKIGRIY